MANKHNGRWGADDPDNPARRPLPELDASREEPPTPSWMVWRRHSPTTVAGWYWVCGPKMWPQVIEWKYVSGKLRPIGPHADTVWSKFAGPIPDPLPPPSLFKGGKKYFRKQLEFK